MKLNIFDKHYRWSHISSHLIFEHTYSKTIGSYNKLILSQVVNYACYKSFIAFKKYLRIDGLLFSVARQCSFCMISDILV